MLKNTESAYGTVARILHWTIALLILMMLVMGFTMKGLEDSPDKLWVYGLHKSIGNLILMLAGVRVIWWAVNAHPKPLATHAAWEKTLSKAAHFLLYAAMIAMPLSGWVMSSAGDFKNSFFGLFEMPDIAPKDEGLLGLMRGAHEFIAFAIIGLVGLHIAGALKHHFIDRDETLARMTWRGFGLKSGLALAVIILLAGAALASVAGPYVLNKMQKQQESIETVRTVAVEGAPDSEWVIDHGQSAIRFSATQYGEAFKGEFSDFGGSIIFDPEALESARADITINIASISTGASERDEQARAAEWFDTASFPQARFTAESFAGGDGAYTAHGSLTIRGVTLPVTLPFTLRIESGESGAETALMEARIELKRLDFGIGQGEWQKTDAIGDTVDVSISVRAQRR